MKQIVEHMTRNRLWSCEQHAYHTGLSTATALLTLQEEWLDNMDKNLDMSAAFDTVRHKILLKKLRIYGMGEHVLRLLENYLSHRLQCVGIRDPRSEFVWMCHGVPQGP